MKIKIAASALGLAAALTTSATAGHSQVPLGPQLDILSLGGDLYASYLGENALLRSELWFFGSVNPGPSQSPPAIPGVFLFANHGSNISGYDGSMALGSPTTNLNLELASGAPFAAGAELVFGLFVNELNGGAGRWFYTGATGYNPDSRIHASVTDLGGTVQVGFEDLCQVNLTDPICASDPDGLIVDWDYNDHLFQIAGATTTPEPVSMALLGTGLAGLAGVARRRRQSKLDELA